MFPDPTLVWQPYPSMMDGIKRPPYIWIGRHSKGVLSLVVVECPPATRAYGVEIACEIFCGVEEMFYSIAHHGDKTGNYDGTIYIKEAKHSRLLEVFRTIDPINRKPRHFLFCGW